MSRKIGIDTSDPETKAVWETAKRARDEVASWPAWKRGDACGWVVYNPHRLCGGGGADLYRVTAPTARLLQQLILLCEAHRESLESRGFLCEPIETTGDESGVGSSLETQVPRSAPELDVGEES